MLEGLFAEERQVRWWHVKDILWCSVSVGKTSEISGTHGRFFFKYIFPFIVYSESKQFLLAIIFGWFLWQQIVIFILNFFILIFLICAIKIYRIEHYTS